MNEAEQVPGPVGSPVERPVGRPVPKRAYNLHAPCPNPPLGSKCPLCGGELHCMEPWRRKS